MEKLPWWWAKETGATRGGFKDYIICVNTREVDQAQLTRINNLIIAKRDLSSEIVGTNKHRRTAKAFIRNSGLVPDPYSESVMNLSVDLMLELFGFDGGHVNPLANSGLRRKAIGESIQVNVLEAAFEPLTKLWDDDDYWKERGCRSPKQDGGWALWVMCNGIGAVEVAFHRVMLRAGQHVRMMLNSECQSDLNVVVASWVTAGMARGGTPVNQAHLPRSHMKNDVFALYSMPCVPLLQYSK